MMAHGLLAHGTLLLLVAIFAWTLFAGIDAPELLAVIAVGTGAALAR